MPFSLRPALGARSSHSCYRAESGRSAAWAESGIEPPTDRLLDQCATRRQALVEIQIISFVHAPLRAAHTVHSRMRPSGPHTHFIRTCAPQGRTYISFGYSACSCRWPLGLRSRQRSHPHRHDSLTTTSHPNGFQSAGGSRAVFAHISRAGLTHRRSHARLCTRPLSSLQPRASPHATALLVAATRLRARDRSHQCSHAPPRTRPPSYHPSNVAAADQT